MGLPEGERGTSVQSTYRGGGSGFDSVWLPAVGSRQLSLRCRAPSWIAVAALFVIVPLAVLAGIFVSSDRLNELQASPVPFVEAANATKFDQRIGVVVTPEWTEAAALFAPAWFGTVGRVDLRANTAIRTGDAIGSIDGVTRLAVATPEPFYRALGPGDGGPDVVWLHDVLVRLGHLREKPLDASVMSATTLTAVRAMATALNVAGTVDAFDPGWFVWLPEEPFAVAAVALTAGAPAPPAGNVLASSSKTLTGVGLTRADGGPLGLQAGVEYVLMLDDVEVRVDPVTVTVLDDDLRALSSVLTPSMDSAAGTVHRSKPLAVWPIPSAAVMAGADGRLCLWIEGQVGFEAITVELLAAQAGVAFVRPPAADDTKVLQNPAEVLAEPACPSN